jgi:site-specific DNA recombinase
MDKLIRAVAYYRKSDDDDGESVSQQRTWAHEQSEEDGAVILREFTDQSKKGWDTAKRTDFHAMLAYCQEQARLKNPVEAIYCWKTNRFSRSNSFETGSFFDNFMKAGGFRLRAQDRWFDLRRKEDRALLNLEQDFTNHEYVKNLAADSLRGRIKTAQEGRRCGGPIPYAYRPEREECIGKKGRRYLRTKRLILGPDDEVAVVKRIFAEYVSGMKGYRAIANGLNESGIPAPAGGLWIHTAIKRILEDSVYMGRNAYGKRQVGKFFAVISAKVTELDGNGQSRADKADWITKDGCHDPIITAEVWNKAQDVKARRGGPRGPASGDYALTGIIRCGHCGCRMSGRSASSETYGNPRRHRYYECRGATQYGSARCQYRSVDAEALVKAIVDKMLPDWLTPDIAQMVREEIRRQDAAEDQADPKELEALRRRIEKQEREIDRATDELIQTDDQEQIERLRARVKRLSAQQSQSRTELAALESKKPERNAEDAVDKAMAMIDRLRNARSSGDRAEQRAVLHEAVARVEVYFEKREKKRSKFAKALVFLVPDVNIIYTTVPYQLAYGGDTEAGAGQ